MSNQVEQEITKTVKVGRLETKVSYTEVHLTKEQQIRMCGNSVCPPVAAAIVRANVPEMAIWGKTEKALAA